MSAFENLQEVHCCSLESQCNIYSMCRLNASLDETRLLIVSLGGKVLCVGFNEKMIPSSRELHFTYIPGDAEIVSIDSFKKCQNGSGGTVIGITFIKPYNGKSFYYLNIYSDSEFESDLDRIAQGCQSLPLSFMPYQLYHTELFHSDGQAEMVFLLSGADQKVHVFREARNTHMFIEGEDIENFFPELADLPGIVLRLQCVYFDDNKKRLTVIGCQNYYVAVALVDVASKDVLKSFQIQHDSPISSVNIFELANHVPVPSSVTEALDDVLSESRHDCDFHLLISSSLEPAIVYSNVLEREFSDPLLLPESDSFDSVLCSLVADVDFDGENEIILGTYGQELLVYKLQPRLPRIRKISCNVPSNGASSVDVKTPDADQGALILPRQSCLPGSLLDCEYSLVGHRTLPEPVMALDEADLMSDGLNEIVVLTLKGLHVLQHDLMEASEVCLSRLKQIYETQNRSSRSLNLLNKLPNQSEELQNQSTETSESETASATTLPSVH